MVSAITVVRVTHLYVVRGEHFGSKLVRCCIQIAPAPRTIYLVAVLDRVELPLCAAGPCSTTIVALYHVANRDTEYSSKLLLDK